MEKALEKILGCPCTRLEPMKSVGPVMKAYREAQARGAKEGFTPLLLPAEDEDFLEELWDYTSLEKYRESLLGSPVADGKAWLERAAAEARKWAERYGGADEDPGPMEGGEGSDEFAGIVRHDGGPWKTVPLALAEIPVKNPWEVFAWAPFGGWNECPAPDVQMAVAKYWYEKHGAVPAVMTRDVLEYAVPAPVKREEASALALEQYIFCSDIVAQGCGSVGVLADILAKSTTWFFWWD